ncbi:DUF4856 domain-containing protein [Salmonirosea aquatica]|uniref:DUF4856 domain-containing protein n=1 Tax=Salmonirosea aquatica TaxID=2654236 RepID=A0A7C9F250_9BACT|nr:DUF4856 domain-containing protein [Cytophagaceae bacterium SJW1-29]
MKITPLITLALAALLFSCTDNTGVDPDGPKEYTVPTTYDFENVDYKESASRISMWQGFQSYLGKGTSRVLSADTVNYLWNNTNNAFTAELASNIPYPANELNTLTYNLSGKTADALLFKALADSMVYVSQFNKAAASKGVPGKIGNRLFNYKGLEYNQSVAKGLMGGLVLHNVVAILDKIPTDNNTTVVPGQGTAMEHNWDLAFGYVGIPMDYDTAYSYNTQPVRADRPLAMGGYFAERGKYIQAGGRVFEAFRTGRAAISAQDYAARDAAIVTIKEYLEKTLAAAAYNYVTSPQTQTALDSKFHGLSEGAGFIIALKYRPASSQLTAANYQTLASIMDTSFYTLAEDASNAKLKQAQAILTEAYGKLQP